MKKGIIFTIAILLACLFCSGLVACTKKYVVTFDTQGGDQLDAVTFSEGDTFFIDAMPSKKGYQFVRWQSSLDSDAVTINSATVIDKDMTIFAIWRPIEYTVTYNLDGGVNSTVNPTTFNVETSTINLSEPTKTNCVFDGWYDNQDLSGNPVTAIQIGTFGNQSYWAKWVASFDTEILDDNTLKINGLTANLTGTELIIPQTFKGKKISQIAADAFRGKEFTSVKIFEGLKTIGIGAFQDCQDLTTVVLPQTLTDLCDYAFYGCSNLSTINLPLGLSTIGDYAFYGCNKLSTMNLPFGLSTIGDYAFDSCTGLTTLRIPYSVSYIGTDAFAGWTTTQILNFDIAKQQKSWDINWAENTGATIVWKYNNQTSQNSLFSYVVYDNKAYVTAYNGEETITEITVPAQLDGLPVTEIANTFEESSLQTIRLSETLTKIGDYAFSDAKQLKTITFASNSIFTYIGNHAFDGCNLLETISLPQSVTTIGAYAFFACTALTSVTMFDNVTTMGESAFARCGALTTIQLSAALTTIETNAFMYCSNLTSLTLPNALVTIKDYAFDGCTALTSVTIPASVNFIGKNAFNNCTALNSVTFETTANWFVTQNSTASYGTSVTLTDATNNALLLKTTYKDYYWKRLL